MLDTIQVHWLIGTLYLYNNAGILHEFSFVCVTPFHFKEGPVTVIIRNAQKLTRSKDSMQLSGGTKRFGSTSLIMFVKSSVMLNPVSETCKISSRSKLNKLSNAVVSDFSAKNIYACFTIQNKGFKLEN